MNLSYIKNCLGPWVATSLTKRSKIEWVQLISSNNFQKPKIFFIEPNCTTKSVLYSEISKNFSFPDYFGNNLSAMRDLLNDGDVVDYQTVIVVIIDGEKFLAQEDDEVLQGFLSTLEIVGSEWAIGGEWPWCFPPRSFYTIIQTEKSTRRFDLLPSAD